MKRSSLHALAATASLLILAPFYASAQLTTQLVQQAVWIGSIGTSNYSMVLSGQGAVPEPLILLRAVSWLRRRPRRWPLRPRPN